jgi:2-methylcitrate dehydratase PrpD
MSSSGHSDGGASLSLRVAEHVVSLEADAIPEAVRETAKTSIIDQIGVILAASGIGEGIDPFIALARATGGDAATILGQGLRTSPAMAALANGAMAHALDFEDTHDATLVHPYAAALPAALALAEWTGASGADLLAGVIAGADLACRVALAFDSNPEAADNVSLLPLINVFGAAAAAARVLRLTPSQCVQAFAIVHGRAAVSADYKRYGPSQFRGVRDAFNAEAGVTAALLAQGGFEMAADPIGAYLARYAPAPRPERLLDSLGERFENAAVSFKPWACCRGTHAFVEAALALRPEPSLVRQIEVEVSPFFAELCERPPHPQTEIAAKFHIPFAIGTALAQGNISFANFKGAALDDAETLRLAALVRHRVDPTLDHTAGTLTLALADGRRLSRTVLQPKGHPSNPMSQDEIDAKFADCARFAKVRPSAEALRRFAAFRHLETLPHIKGLLP